MIRLLFGQHLELNQLIRHLRYNDPWPNCFQHQIVQIRNCLVFIKFSKTIYSFDIDQEFHALGNVSLEIDKKTVLKRGPYSLDRIASIVPGSKSTKTARGTYLLFPASL